MFSTVCDRVSLGLPWDQSEDTVRKEEEWAKKFLYHHSCYPKQLLHFNSDFRPIRLNNFVDLTSYINSVKENLKVLILNHVNAYCKAEIFTKPLEFMLVEARRPCVYMPSGWRGLRSLVFSGHSCVLTIMI